jgi:protein tyrosine/serine phosphatase
MTIDESRIVHLEGVVNFRDLGGLPTSNGRTVRRGRIFRSDVLYRLTPRDMNALGELGIRTVIDLRSRDEVRKYPQSSLNTAGLRQVNVPLISDTHVVADTMLDDYLLVLRNAGEGFRVIFGLLSRDAYPLVINCFAGKDRTGLVSALILGALGTPNHAIVADYALSERHMLRHFNLHRASNDVPAHTGPLPDWLVATPATMAMTLDAIADEWGSVPGYLEANGVSVDDLRRISNALVESLDDGVDEP